jgi:hypothetical protein
VKYLIGTQRVLQTGDILYEVNRNNVYCTNPEEIGGYLLGHEGTQVI